MLLSRIADRNVQPRNCANATCPCPRVFDSAVDQGLDLIEKARLGQQRDGEEQAETENSIRRIRRRLRARPERASWECPRCRSARTGSPQRTPKTTAGDRQCRAESAGAINGTSARAPIFCARRRTCASEASVSRFCVLSASRTLQVARECQLIVPVEGVGEIFADKMPQQVLASLLPERFRGITRGPAIHLDAATSARPLRARRVRRRDPRQTRSESAPRRGASPEGTVRPARWLR